MSNELRAGRRLGVLGVLVALIALVGGCVIEPPQSTNGCSPNGTIGADGSPSILGPATLSAEDLAKWFKSQGASTSKIPGNPSIDQVAQQYINNPEGVRGDWLFIQTMWETGWFTNSDTAINNFAGIGHYDNAASGFDYPSWEAGVIAQAQRLKKVVQGNDAQLSQPVYMQSKWMGKQTDTWSGLAQNWATDPNYWNGLNGMFNQAMKAAGKTEVNNTGGSTSGSGGCSAGGTAGDPGPNGDYGYAEAIPGGQMGGVDPWNFYAGQCVSFTAYMVRTTTKHKDFHNHWRGQHFGNANHWDEAARGANIPVDSTPAPGAIAQTNRGNYGHVAYVTAVNPDGTIDIAEYNYAAPEKFGTRKGLPASEFDNYLHFER